MNILWLQIGRLRRLPTSLLCAESPGVMELLDGAGLRILWHPSLSVEDRRPGGGACWRAVEAGEQPLDILCVEGSILRGPNGTGR